MSDNDEFYKRVHHDFSEPIDEDEYTPTEKVGAVIEELRKTLELEPVQPSNEDLALYIRAWIESLDGDGLVITSWIPIEKALEDSDFGQLRKKFGK